MKKLRTRHFHIALTASFAVSALFLAWFMLFGKRLAGTNFVGVSDAVMALLAIAAGSFLIFCFVPYFRGDRRWYAISTVLTVTFCIGCAMLWQVGGPAVVL